MLSAWQCSCSYNHECGLNGRTSRPSSGSTTDCSYDSITTLSTYWASDNTGSKEDSELFLNTLSNLGLTGTFEILNNTAPFDLAAKYRQMSGLLTGCLRLFILHYAGHAVQGSTARDLTLVPKIKQEEGPTLDFSLVKGVLKSDTMVISGYGLLFRSHRREGRNSGGSSGTYDGHITRWYQQCQG
jgi:hypothetical protein